MVFGLEDTLLVLRTKMAMECGVEGFGRQNVYNLLEVADF